MLVDKAGASHQCLIRIGQYASVELKIMPALWVYLQTGRGASVVQGGAQAVAVVEQDLVAAGLDQYRGQARQVSIERGAGRASRIITAIGASATGQPSVAEHDVPVSVEQVVEAQG